MIQVATDVSETSRDHPESEVVAKLCLSNNYSDLSFKRYGDGSVMLSQGNDLVYLESEQFEMLKRFMQGVKP